ncbi:MAG: sugar ABC transporter permease [Thermoprotei archaeon]|nr:MAG: sugar ABC transporter permease [Thermoprotei archaeon]
MVFSIGIAFTNADQWNILPAQEKIGNYTNLLKCATYLRDSPEHRAKAPQLLGDIENNLNQTLNYFINIKNMLDEGVEPIDIPQTYFDGLYRSARKLSRVKLSISELFNCSALGYPTNLELIPSDKLEKIDSLITLSSILVNGRFMNKEELYDRVLVGYNITMDLANFFGKLEHDYEGYMNEVISSSQSKLEDLQMRFVGFENFQRLFKDPRFYNSLYKTMLFVLTSVTLKMGAGVLLAIFYSSELVMGRKALRALLMIPWAMPFLLSALTWKFLFSPNGQLGQLLGLEINVREWDAFLVYNLFEMWLAYPFVMTVTQGALRGVPKEVIEASYVDGAGVFTRLKEIILPLIAKPVSLAAVLTTGASLQAFLVPLTINSAGPIGEICAPYVGCTSGYKNEMLIVFGYHRVMIDKEYGYAATTYLVILAIILLYVTIYFKLLKKTG